MIFCSVFLNLKTIEKSFADGDMEYTVDSAKVLTTEELESLKSKLAQISDENNIDVGVVTVDYLWMEKVHKNLQMIYLSRINLVKEKTEMEYFF